MRCPPNNNAEQNREKKKKQTTKRGQRKFESALEATSEAETAKMKNTIKKQQRKIYSERSNNGKRKMHTVMRFTLNTSWICAWMHTHAMACSHIHKLHTSSLGLTLFTSPLACSGMVIVLSVAEQNKEKKREIEREEKKRKTSTNTSKRKEKEEKKNTQSNKNKKKETRKKEQ